MFSFKGTDLRVQGGGKIHAIHVDIQSTNLIVDDLGEIIGDYHDLTCVSGNGVAGTTGSGKSNYIYSFRPYFNLKNKLSESMIHLLLRNETTNCVYLTQMYTAL